MCRIVPHFDFLPACSGKVHHQEFLSVRRRIAYEFESHLSFLPAAFMTLLSEGKFLSRLKLPALQFIVPAITTRRPRFEYRYICALDDSIQPANEEPKNWYALPGPSPRLRRSETKASLVDHCLALTAVCVCETVQPRLSFLPGLGWNNQSPPRDDSLVDGCFCCFCFSFFSSLPALVFILKSLSFSFFPMPHALVFSICFLSGSSVLSSFHFLLFFIFVVHVHWQKPVYSILFDSIWFYSSSLSFRLFSPTSFLSFTSVLCVMVRGPVCVMRG